MKRKFLVLSVTMLTVCGAALLQSCSSEFEYYDTTSEYGYYTEEEIELMEEVAQCYNLDVEIKSDYYGKKLTMEEFTRDLTLFACFPGEYTLVPNIDSTEYSFVKKEGMKRTAARCTEARLPNNGSTTLSDNTLPFPVTLSWHFGSTSDKNVVLFRADDQYQLIGGGTSELTRAYVNVNHTYSFYNGGIRYGRYNIAGTYYAYGRQEFKIIKVQ